MLTPEGLCFGDTAVTAGFAVEVKAGTPVALSVGECAYESGVDGVTGLSVGDTAVK